MRVVFSLVVSLGSLGFVVCFPLKDCRMCPFAIASDFGRDFRTSCLVSPGQVERELFLIALINVDVHGLHNARWRKYTGQFLILLRINYRQNDAQESCIPSYPLGRVDFFPLKYFLMCPFAVASYFGRNFRTSCLVSTGQVKRNFFLIALIYIDVHGLHNARWRKIHRSVFDFA